MDRRAEQLLSRKNDCFFVTSAFLLIIREGLYSATQFYVNKNLKNQVGLGILFFFIKNHR